MKYLLALPLMLLMVSGAYADGLYVKGGASLANLSEFNTDNVGYSGEVGWITDVSIGDLAVGLEYSDHVHLGKSTQGGAVNASFYMGDWVIQPYVSGGVGATFEGDPFGQAGGGLLWVANDGGESGSFGIFAGYEHRWYFDTDFSNTGDDGYVKAGLMLTF